MTTEEPYELHYGASEAYDAFDRLNWLAELGIDEHGRIIVKRILSDHNKPLISKYIDPSDRKYDTDLIKSIRKRNAEIERQKRGGKTKRRLRKNIRRSMKKRKSIRRKKTIRKKNISRRKNISRKTIR
uniref:Uncharacterized protein n=1 Tax=viral metagenome TaxID=1070528 RepID=A0A6C0IHM7_9ZZZZ